MARGGGVPINKFTLFGVLVDKIRGDILYELCAIIDHNTE